MHIQIETETAGPRTGYRVTAQGPGAREAVEAEVARLMEIDAGRAEFTHPIRLGRHKFGALGYVERRAA